jgi:hypothetical protein
VVTNNTKCIDGCHAGRHGLPPCQWQFSGSPGTGYLKKCSTNTKLCLYFLWFLNSFLLTTNHSFVLCVYKLLKRNQSINNPEQLRLNCQLLSKVLTSLELQISSKQLDVVVSKGINQEIKYASFTESDWDIKWPRTSPIRRLNTVAIEYALQYL